MSELKESTPVIFFVSFLYNEEIVSNDLIYEELENFFGSYVKYIHSYFPMKDYYSKEMGNSEQLKREFLVFPMLKDREFLVNAKLFCTSMENKLLVDSRRSINVDPGYISLDQVVLSTGKPYSHRIYLQKGVYTELTYRFSKGTFQVLDWTYPDYSHTDIIGFFNWSRQFLNFSN